MYGNELCRNVSIEATGSSREASPETRRSRIYDQGGGSGGKTDVGEEHLEASPPALPPRPHSRPHHTRTRPTSRNNCNCEFSLNADLQRNHPSCLEGLKTENIGDKDYFDFPNNNRRTTRSCWSSGLRKYVFLCTLCGALSILLGALFLTVYFMLKSYTSSLNYFETLPTYIPAAMLITTGFMTSCLACRKNRNSCLIKLCGACSLTCALLCLSVTVTTAVIHMSRLQTFRECYYTGKTRSCTCESVINDGDSLSDDTFKFVFNATSDCEVIHGVLYSCLRAVFGLSVVGILICIFTCMLVYQLLSHEKKKMYWAQLEMRCRYLYGQHGQQPFCSCCDECRYPAPTSRDVFPWELMGNRFLTPGRIGNLYTPNPEDRTEQTRPGWSWRRLPWTRNSANPTTSASTGHRVRPNISSPDSQYGFTSGTTGENSAEGAPYTVIDSTIQTIRPGPPVLRGDDLSEGGFYSWGPPPPYSSNPNSTNNSPARRSLGGLLRQVSPIRRYSVSPAGIHRNRILRQPLMLEEPFTLQVSAPPKISSQPHRTSGGRQSALTSAMQMQMASSSSNRSTSLASVSHSDGDHKLDNYENTSELEIMCQNRVRNNSGFNTLPSLKKRNQPDLSDVFPNKFSNGSFTSIGNMGSVDLKSEIGATPSVYLESNHGSDDSRLANDASSVGSQSQGSTNNINKQAEETKKSLRSGTEIYQNEPFGQFAKKRVVRKLEYNVLQNKSDLQHDRSAVEKSQFPKNVVRRPIAKPPRSTPATPEHNDARKSDAIVQKLKIISNDPDLIKKHGSLMKEFNGNINRKSKTSTENEKGGTTFGFENYGFQHLEKDPAADFRRSGIDNDVESQAVRYHPKKSARDGRKCKEGTGKEMRTVECESDVYFGDISNSSCYMSLRSEVPESLYEEAMEPKKDNSNGQPLLNKINLKLIEKESCKLDAKNGEYNEVTNPSPSSLESTASVSSSGCKRLRDGSEHSLESFCSNRSGTFPIFSQEGRESADSGKMVDLFGKSLHEPKNHCGHFNHLKRGHQLPNQFRPVREPFHNSNDEQSSSSLTADSGISSGRNYLPRGYYCENPQLESLSADSESSLDIIKSSTDGLTLYQKPKVHPRGGRCRELDELESLQDAEINNSKLKMAQSHIKKNKKHYSSSPQGVESSSLNQESHPPNPKPRGSTKGSESLPKPLPRTTISKTKRISPSDCDSRHILDSGTNFKSFLAPDAQYDCTDSNIKSKSKCPRLAHGSPRSKPIIPARPLHLPPKSNDKPERLVSSLVTPPRRRQKGEPADLGTGIDYHSSTSHSVHV